jgi:hypothetical protein
MVAVIAAVFVAFFLYYYSGGPDFGPRYWYLMLVPLIALTVQGMGVLGMRIGGATGSARVGVAVALLCLMALLIYVPWRAVDKYTHFWGMRPDVRVLAKEYGFGRSLVLVQGETHPDYTSAAVYNPLDLGADAPIYAWDRDPQVRQRLLDYYDDRPVWILKGPSLTRDGYRLLGGPLQAGDPLLREEMPEGDLP